MKNVVAATLCRVLVGGIAVMAVSGPGCSKAKESSKASTVAPSPVTPDPSAANAPGPAQSPAKDPKDPAAPRLAADPAAMAEVARGDLTFASALHAELRKEPGNLFFSPASVRLAMAMTAMGARGKTADELTAGLGLAKDPAQNAAGFAAILDSFAQRGKPARNEPASRDREAAPKDSTVAIANRVWPQAGRKFEQSFADTMATRFGAPMQPLDFAAGPEAARKTINAWVAEQTAQKIPELLLPPHINAATRLVLTNAIYFKAQWAEAFEEQATGDGTFTTDRGAKAKVRMMARTDELKYAETATYQAVELPYAGGSLAMTIFLPRAGKSLDEVEASALAAAPAAMTMQRVEVKLPRFKLESRFSLADTLSRLGMASAFAQGPADFSGIDGTRDLFIGNVIHQAVISVDESGTEAAAATAVVMTPGGAPPPADPPKQLIADHPFAFFIRDAATGVVLFVGRLADPTAVK